MKFIRDAMLGTVFLLFTVGNAWAGAEGLFLVYQLETSDVNGALNLRPVEVQFDMAGDTNPAYGVFAEWLRPYIHDSNQINLEQRNAAYCKGLKADINNSFPDHIEVSLDYSGCSGKSKPRSDKDKLLEGIAAAILYTENVPNIKPVPTVRLKVKGMANVAEFTKTFSWQDIQKKWQPWWGGFQNHCK
jgi:hypothetical protein